MQDISGSGISITFKFSQTFPSGFTFTDFADDADPFDMPALIIAATAMNVNGQMVTWSAPTPILPTINAIPGSNGDNNLAIAFEANRASQGKRIAKDIVTIVAVYPDGSTCTLSNGKMISGFPGKSVASAGRLKSKAYAFAFQDISVTRVTQG